MPRLWRTPFVEPAQGVAAVRLGMWIFLASLAMLFAASIVGFAVIRVQLRDQWPEDLPGLPGVVYLGTAVLLASGVTAHLALAATRRGAPGRAALWVTGVLGCIFLGLQGMAAAAWLDRLGARWQADDGHRFALAAFLALSAVHGLHVAGGLVPILAMAARGGCRGGRLTLAPLRLCVMYWHFLEGVWMALLAALLLGR
jgi:cytochrome c oxidase subunit 3